MEEEETESVTVEFDNINIETAGTEEEAEEGLKAVLGMEIEDECEGEGEVEEGGDGTQRAQGALEFLTEEADPRGTILVDAHNGFNKLRRLAMPWTGWHRLPSGARFAFNCYRHCAKILLRQPGEPPVTILSREGINQGDPLSMVLYGITLFPSPSI